MTPPIGQRKSPHSSQIKPILILGSPISDPGPVLYSYVFGEKNYSKPLSIEKSITTPSLRNAIHCPLRLVLSWDLPLFLLRYPW